MTRLLRVAAALTIAMSGATLLVWTCGPDPIELATTVALHPARYDAFASGELGVVRPTYARSYLVEAYRILSGRPPLKKVAPAAVRPAPYAYPSSAAATWVRGSAEVLNEPPPPKDRYVEFATTRPVPGSDYQHFDNCLDESFEHAVRTLEARRATFGAASAELREWTRAQRVVFSNCGNAGTLFVPPPLPADTHALLRADREYQIAAAHFYGMAYEDAARRFVAIGRMASSPWRPYGRYLAGRTRIRQATLASDDDPRKVELFALAETELAAALADPTASTIHESARGLQLLIEDRVRPVNRLHTLTTRLTTAEAADPHEFGDYTRILDRFAGDTTEYTYRTVKHLDAVIAADDANDWVLAFQGGGEEATERAVLRWRQTRSLPWLIAVLWKIPPDHAIAPEVLDAASMIDAQSPGFASVAFLRVRLLAHRGTRTDARAVLATLPSQPGAGIDDETINLLKAERLMLADTFDEFLENASRTSLAVDYGPSVSRLPVLDGDAADTLTYQMPFARLIEAARSTRLPDRIRTAVAAAALARAIVLKREDVGLRAAAVLRPLAPPSLCADIDRYMDAATSADRHFAGVILMLRTPGLRAYVTGPEYLRWSGSQDAPRPMLSRQFDHIYHENWWCVYAGGAISRGWEERSTLRTMLYGSRPVAAPAFLTAADTAAAARELRALWEVGHPRAFLATETLAWARTRRADPLLPELLAHVVESGRWASCGNREQAAALSRRAFETLHRLYPESDWARRTKYWHR